MEFLWDIITQIGLGVWDKTTFCFVTSDNAETCSNAFVSGLLTGLVYGLSALGLSVIFGVIRIVNFAHGELMIIGMYFALVMFNQFGIDPLISVPFAAALMFFVGYGLQAAVISRVSHLPDHMQFMLLAAMAIAIVSGLLLVFGPDEQSVSVDYAWNSIQIFWLTIDYPRIFAAIAAIIASGLLFAFFRFTLTGKAIRACADNRMGARVVGLNVDRLYSLTFAIGGACLGAAGSIIILLMGVEPYRAPVFTLLAFIIVIIGGMGSLVGALLGGILIGVSEAMAATLFEPSLKTAFSFALLILVLLLRPQGLLGRAAR